MVYGNIYDPAWREQQLLKELNIQGEEDDENNPDYTADDGENADGAEGGEPEGSRRRGQGREGHGQGHPRGAVLRGEGAAAKQLEGHEGRLPAGGGAAAPGGGAAPAG